MLSDESKSLLQKRKTYGSLMNASAFAIIVCGTAEKCYRLQEKISNFRRTRITEYLATEVLSILPRGLRLTINEEKERIRKKQKKIIFYNQ